MGTSWGRQGAIPFKFLNNQENFLTSLSAGVSISNLVMTDRRTPDVDTHREGGIMQNIRRNMLAITVFLVVMVMAEFSYGQLSITIDSAGPNVPASPALGYPITFRLAGTKPGYSITPAWKWQQTDAAGPTWSDIGATTYTTLGTNCGTPGKFDYQCTVTYSGGYPPLPAPETAKISIVVPKPSSFTIVSGLNTDTPVTSVAPTATSTAGSNGVWVRFKLRAGGVDVGPNTVLYDPQEKITNLVVDGLPQQDKDWAPGAGTSDVRFYLGVFSGNTVITDFKHVMGDAGWDSAFIGETIATYTQEIRISWKDTSGFPYSVSLGSVNFTIEKTGTDDFQIY
jgi:hypothetical protein